MTSSALDLFELASQLNEGMKKGSGEAALRNAGVKGDFAQVITRIVMLTKATIDESATASFRSEARRDDLIKRVQLSSETLLNALSRRGGGNTSGPLVNDIVLERLRSAVEIIEEKTMSSSRASSRDQMIEETESLIKDVKDWDIEEYAKNTLLMQLNSIERVIQMSDLYSERELRDRVKAVIADFAAEFSQADKKYQSRMERMMLWARRGFFAGSVVLGLTADITTIAGMLPPPSLQIGKN